MQTDHYKDFTILHRMMGIVSSTIKITGASTYHLLRTVKFSDFISLIIRGDKMNKSSKLLTKINSIESYTRDIVLKMLPEPSHELQMFYKNSQALYLSKELMRYLTLYKMAY
jgi:hypothetical protein